MHSTVHSTAQYFDLNIIKLRNSICVFLKNYTNVIISPGNGEVRVSRNMPKLKFGRKVGLVVLMKSDKVPMNPRMAFQVTAISR